MVPLVIKLVPMVQMLPTNGTEHTLGQTACGDRLDVVPSITTGVNFPPIHVKDIGLPLIVPGYIKVV